MVEGLLQKLGMLWHTRLNKGTVADSSEHSRHAGLHKGGLLNRILLGTLKLLHCGFVLEVSLLFEGLHERTTYVGLELNTNNEHTHL